MNVRKNTKRRWLSEVTKRIIAHDQSYMCMGSVCEGDIMLPQTWEVDHVRPLHLGGSNDLYNLQVLCPNCHALKTLTETQKRYKKRQEEIRRSPFFTEGHEKFLSQFLYKPKFTEID
jgi:5-methylcytosine-specific restriction endonuclease McrA